MSDLEHVAIERLKAASEMSLQHYGLPLVITDSGGKDSSVCKELALLLPLFLWNYEERK